MILADVALRCTRSGIHKLGHRGDKLCRREWLGQKDAVGNALRGPLVGMSASHVDDGNWGSTSLACRATSQPSIRPRRPMSVTSARYLAWPPFTFSRVTASSPDAAMAGSKPPSLRASATRPCTAGSSSITKMRSGSSNAKSSPIASPNSSRGTWGFVPTLCTEVYLEDSAQHHPLGTRPLAGGRFLQLRQCFIDRPSDGILCGRPRRSFVGLERLVVQPNAPLPGMRSDALNDGIALAAIFHMEPTRGNPGSSRLIFFDGREPAPTGSYVAYRT